MGEHYYTKNPSVKSDRIRIAEELRGRRFQFTTDSGVFSKKEVDFGSKLLIDTFEEPEIEGDIVDVGCGYGPIGISLASEFSNRRFYLLDVNERATELAMNNAIKSSVNNVTVMESDQLSAVKDKTFASVITNPPIRAGKQVVHGILEEAHEVLKKDGTLWVVIQKKQGAPSAINKLEEMFKHVETVVKKKGYYILKAVK
ncbi:class I SAM-dependent methyltransferase [Pseudalkalibacillus hwajinpoensis]|uniref:Class I SAM-dependent methyltransferase n=1 Tax=Guptibacillus hwajinpoensis TaxID=208199 RepID=A0A4U1MA82_9BACL|nr:class I SAM-dependent methyltransferase [Pseudalkalibacillus hwajinpoensis]TKD67172.1 class I SAM-dependent methyltransferase [Pseudalkalibacillus hwajinpoensis]